MRENFIMMERIKGPGIVIRRPGGHSEHVSLDTLHRLRRGALGMAENAFLFIHPLTREPVYRRNLKLIKKVPVHKVSSNEEAQLHYRLMNSIFKSRKYNFLDPNQVYMKRDMIKAIMASYFHNRLEGKRVGNLPGLLAPYTGTGLNRNGLGPKQVYDVLRKLPLKTLRELFLTVLW
jgi:hypothetical protein